MWEPSYPIDPAQVYGDWDLATAQSRGSSGEDRGVARHLERMSMGDFYGIEPGTIPGFAEAGGGKFMGVEGLPSRTVTNMVAFMEKLYRMYEDDSLAFEVCVRHVASAIEDQRRSEGRADPRNTAS
jgi:hypothetical protein